MALIGVEACDHALLDRDGSVVGLGEGSGSSGGDVDAAEPAVVWIGVPFDQAGRFECHKHLMCGLRAVHAVVSELGAGGAWLQLRQAQNSELRRGDPERFHGGLQRDPESVLGLA